MRAERESESDTYTHAVAASKFECFTANINSQSNLLTYYHFWCIVYFFTLLLLDYFDFREPVSQAFVTHALSRGNFVVILFIVNAVLVEEVEVVNFSLFFAQFCTKSPKHTRQHLILCVFRLYLGFPCVAIFFFLFFFALLCFEIKLNINSYFIMTSTDDDNSSISFFAPTILLFSHFMRSILL